MQPMHRIPVAIAALVVGGLAIAVAMLSTQPQRIRLPALASTSAPEEHSPFAQGADIPPEPVQPPPGITRLPPVLTPSDIQRYQVIFRAVRQGNWQEVALQKVALHNRILEGHLLAKTLLHPEYAASYAEITHWLAQYGDHPQAKRLRALAEKKRPADAEALPALPQADYLNGYGSTLRTPREASHRLFSADHWKGRAKAQKTWREVLLLVGDGLVTKAYNRLQKARKQFSAVEYDLALWRIASGYYAYGKDEKAYRVARIASQRSGHQVPELHWYAGLASWRMQQYSLASRHFAAMTARPDKLSPWQVSAAAYWAHRAYHQQQKPDEAITMLEIAASYPRTFYGILAMRSLARSLPLQFTPAVLTPGELMLLRERYPGISRAMALAQIGLSDSAEEELRHVYLQLDVSERAKMLPLTRALNLPALSLRIAGGMARRGTYHDFSLYPVPKWPLPSDNPALLLAIIRQESNFRENASSDRGAQGLMQLMPRTAAYIARKARLPVRAESLLNPQDNIRLGNEYVNYLRRKPDIGNNLLYLLAAYNAGPGKLNLWKKTIAYQNDPLLFMESIPSPETRKYVEQVMANYWIYRLRLAYEPRSAEAVAAGIWPGEASSSLSVVTKTHR